MDEAQATDTSTADSSASIENYDFSLPNGGLDAEVDSQESEDSSNATTDEADQADNNPADPV